MMWMDVDTALSEVPVNLIALTDDTDFKSIEASVVYNAAGMTLLWNFTTTAGATTQTAVTPTTAGDYDWTNQGNGFYTLEITASGGASINNDTEGFGYFSGVADGVLPWRGPTIGFRAAALNTALVNGDGIAVFAAKYAGPRGPGIYLNDAAGNTNTVNGTDGTFDNPVSTIAAVKTLADSMSIDRIYLVNDSVITLAAAMPDYEFVGIGEMSYNTIDLGSQSVDHSYFENVLLSGVQGGTARMQAKCCVLSAITSMEISALHCVVADGSALVLRNDCMFEGCWSAVAGASTPTLDINSVANVNVYFRHYSGGITITNAVSTTVMSWEGIGQFIVDATCTSLSIVPRGIVTYTDNGTTTNLLTADAAINRTNINAEADTALADYDGPTKTEMDTAHGLLATEAKQDIIDTNVDQIEAAVITNAAGADIAADIIAVKVDTAATLVDTADIGVAGAGLTDLGGMSTGMKAEVNVEALDVLVTDNHTEPSSVPAATASIKDMVHWLFSLARNKATQTSTTKTLRNDSDAADIGSAAVSSDGTTFTRDKWS